MEYFNIAELFPKQILEMANLFWSYSPIEENYFNYHRESLEESFGLESYTQSDYRPASAWQTPIYRLLHSAPKETIDFILSFTNKSIINFIENKFVDDIDEVELFIDENTIVKQYINQRLWCIYRGSQTTPYLLESIHMALEAYLLRRDYLSNPKDLNETLLYLLRNSKSASITAVVASIISYYPHETFEVAVILFKVKTLFFIDNSRLTAEESSARFSILDNSYSIYKKERLDSKKLKNRSTTLETLFLIYQYLEKISTEKKEVLWTILDNYYAQIPLEEEQSYFDKNWRLCLARMDLRKMNPTEEIIDSQVIVRFNTKIDDKLLEHRNSVINAINSEYKFSPLKFWAISKFENNPQYLQYKDFIDNPKSAFKIAREIIEKLNSTHKDNSVFKLHNSSIPYVVFPILLRDYSTELEQSEIDYCIKYTLNASAFPLEDNYSYHLHDGFIESFSVLPIIYKNFPEHKDFINQLIIKFSLNIFNLNSLNMEKNISLIINQISDTTPSESFIYVISLLKPKYDDFIKIKENSDLPYKEIFKKFITENKNIYDKINTKILDLSIENLNYFNLETLLLFFQIIPLNPKSEFEKQLLFNIIIQFIERGEIYENNSNNFYLIHDFLEKTSLILLSCPNEEVDFYLNPIISNFSVSRFFSDFFRQIISTQNNLDSNENFIYIWNLFRDKFSELNNKAEYSIYDINNSLKSFLLANSYTYEKKIFNNFSHTFFESISKELGKFSATLYSLLLLLNNSYDIYFQHGISWILHILKNEAVNSPEYLNQNIILELEKYLKKYIDIYYSDIKYSKQKKKNTIIILDFLIDKKSKTALTLKDRLL